MAIPARTLVGAVGVLVVAALIVGFTLLMPKPHADVNAHDGTPKTFSVEVTDAEE